MPRGRRSDDLSDFIVDEGMDVDETISSRRRHRRRVNDGQQQNDDDDVEKDIGFYAEQRHIEFLNKATLVSMNHKGFIKENELKPFLSKGRGDWQEGLKEVERNLEDIFGYSLIHCGKDHIFTLRNNLLSQTSAVSELFNGKLKDERIDDGSYIFRNMLNEETKEEESLLFPVLTIIMMSGGDKPENWTVTGSCLEHFLLTKLEIPKTTYDKLIGGKTPLYVKQYWIKRVIKETDGTEPIHHFYWGPRAIETVSGSKLLEKYCIATGARKAFFGSFHKQLQKEDFRRGLLKEIIEP